MYDTLQSLRSCVSKYRLCRLTFLVGNNRDSAFTVALAGCGNDCLNLSSRQIGRSDDTGDAVSIRSMDDTDS